jgi:hypothetical protein
VSQYRVLAYEFDLTTNDDACAAYIDGVFGTFQVDDVRRADGPRVPARYELLRRDGHPPYALLRDGELLIESTATGVVLDHLNWSVNTEALKRTTTHLLVHAAVATFAPGGALLLVGPSGSGKSTLVSALVQRGFGYLSDEAAVIDPATGLVQPYARPIILKRPPSELLPGLNAISDGVFELQRLWHVDPRAIRPDAVASPALPRLLICPRYDPAAVTSVEPMTRGEAVVAILSNSPSLDPMRDEALRIAARLSESLCSYRLTSPSVDEAVAAIADVRASIG